MTAIEEEPPFDDGRLFCYRHPDRETWVRCGRCDRPICPRCAMQGPVGFRCRDCGRPAFDPMTSFTPAQLAGGLAVAFMGGGLVAVVAPMIGFFSLFLSFLAGGFIAQSITRVTGYKQGPVMLGVVFGGIALGAVAAFVLRDGDLVSLFLQHGAGYGGQDGPSLGSVLGQAVAWALVGVVATCAGAWSRMR
jgi:hypothetical protein